MDDKSIRAVNAFVDKIIDAVETRLAKKPQAGFSQAKVLRVSGDTAWVHIPGGAEETPAKMTINCKKGDTVQVRIGDDGAILVGNDTAPPTDDTKAKAAQETADEALESIGEVQGEVSGTQQHFWYVNGTGSEAGAHVTETSKDKFLNNPTGGNLIMRSNSVRLRMGLNTLAELVSTGMNIYDPTDPTNPLAQFLGGKAVIGKETGIHITLNNGVVTFYKDSTTPIFEMLLTSDTPPQARIRRSGEDKYGELYLTDNTGFLGSHNTNGTGTKSGHCMSASTNTTADAMLIAEYSNGGTYKSASVVAEANSSGSTVQIMADNITVYGDTSLSNTEVGDLDIRGSVTCNNHPVFDTFTATGTITLSSGNGGNVTVTGTVPAGYTPIAVQSIESDHNQTVLIGKFALTSTGASISMRNVGATSYTNMNVTAVILCTALLQ